MNPPKFNQSIYSNKCLLYEDVKQFAKVYFINVVAVKIRRSFSLPKFPVLRTKRHWKLAIVNLTVYNVT